MNRLIRCVISFVLPFFCLLISVSYANIETEVPYYPFGASLSSTAPSSPFADYTYEEIYDILYAYMKTPTDETTNTFNNICSYIDKAGYCIEFIQWNYSSYGPFFEAYIFKKGDGELGINYDSSAHRVNVLFRPSAPTFDLCVVTYSSGGEYYIKPRSYTDSEFNANYIFVQNFDLFYNTPVLSYSTASIKNMTYTNSRWYWDGTYFYEPSVPEEPDTPSLPSNVEIAQAVQSFYNSDYYKNNKDFKEFFVLYNSLKGIYSFIGHNSVGEIANHFEYGSTLSQIIYSDDYPSNTYGLSYWKFNLETLGSQISNIFNNYYWLYSSYDNGESITYDGKGYVTDLLEVEFDSRYSTIVYSSTNYLCRVYDYENEEETINDATISGNQYTYDETLDPTTNEYNPIKDYVPTDPTQSILGDADFDEINKVFEENKNVLDIGNASWLFTANNQLFNYFSGFISFLIVLIIISRLLGG